MAQYLAPLIMMAITLVIAILFLIPAEQVKFKSPRFSFYWSGFWRFIALIAYTSGLMTALQMAGIANSAFSQLVLVLITAAFVAFVVCAWLHLFGLGIFKVYKAVFSRALKALPIQSR